MGETGIAGALIALATIVVGYVQHRESKKADKEKAVGEQYNALAERLTDRINALENRLDAQEKLLDSTRAELWRFQSHASGLRRALAKAMAWIGDAVEWMESDHSTPPPTPPNSEPWNALLEGVSADLDK